MPLTWVIPLVLLLASAGSLRAQSVEFRLDEDGKWIQIDAPVDGTDEATIAEARRDLAEGRPQAARKLLDSWLKQNQLAPSPLVPQAIRLRGDTKVARGNEFNALYDYEQVVKEFTGSEEYLVAIERELDIAVQYVNGLRRQFLAARVLNASDIGEELLIRVQERVPGSQLAERAGIELADFYYRKRNLEMASIAYDLFLQLYPRSPHAKKALRRRIFSIIARYKGPEYDGSALDDAKILIERFARMYPEDSEEAGINEALINRLDESSAAQKLVQARWYLTRNEPVSANYVLKRLVREHPLTAAAGAALVIMEERGWRQPDTPDDEDTEVLSPVFAPAAGEEQPTPPEPEDLP